MSIAATNAHIKILISGDAKRFQGELKSVTNSVKRFAQVAALAMAALGTAIVKTGSDFDQSIRKVSALTDDMSGNLDKLSKAARKMGETTAFSAVQAAEAMYTLVSAGLDVEQTISAASSALQLSGATSSDLQTSVELLAVTMKAWNLEAEESGRVADIFATGVKNSLLTVERLREAMKFAGTVGGSLNQSLESTVALLGKLADQGIISGSLLGTHVRQAMLLLSAGTEKTRRALLELGTSFEKVNPAAHNAVEILQELSKYTVDVAMYRDIFGQRTAASMANLAKGAREYKDSIQELFAELKDGSGTATEIYAFMLQSIQNQFLLFTSKVKEAFIAITTGAREPILGFIQDIQGDMQSLNDYIKQNGENIGQTIGQVVDAFSAFKDVLITLSSPIVDVSLESENLVKWLTALLIMWPITKAAFALAGGITALGTAIGVAAFAFQAATVGVGLYVVALTGLVALASAGVFAIGYMAQAFITVKIAQDNQKDSLEKLNATTFDAIKYQDAHFDAAKRLPDTYERMAAVQAVVNFARKNGIKDVNSLIKAYEKELQVISDGTVSMSVGIAMLNDSLNARQKVIDGVDKHTKKLEDLNDKYKNNSDHLKGFLEDQELQAEAINKASNAIDLLDNALDNGRITLNQYEFNLVGVLNGLDKFGVVPQEIRKALFDMADGVLNGSVAMKELRQAILDLIEDSSKLTLEDLAGGYDKLVKKLDEAPSLFKKLGEMLDLAGSSTIEFSNDVDRAMSGVSKSIINTETGIASLSEAWISNIDKMIGFGEKLTYSVSRSFDDKPLAIFVTNLDLSTKALKKTGSELKTTAAEFEGLSGAYTSAVLKTNKVLLEVSQSMEAQKPIGDAATEAVNNYLDELIKMSRFMPGVSTAFIALRNKGFDPTSAGIKKLQGEIKSIQDQFGLIDTNEAVNEFNDINNAMKQMSENSNIIISDFANSFNEAFSQGFDFGSTGLSEEIRHAQDMLASAFSEATDQIVENYHMRLAAGTGEAEAHKQYISEMEAAERSYAEEQKKLIAEVSAAREAQIAKDEAYTNALVAQFTEIANGVVAYEALKQKSLELGGAAASLVALFERFSSVIVIGKQEAELLGLAMSGTAEQLFAAAAALQANSDLIKKVTTDSNTLAKSQELAAAAALLLKEAETQLRIETRETALSMERLTRATREFLGIATSAQGAIGTYTQMITDLRWALDNGLISAQEYKDALKEIKANMGDAIDPSSKLFSTIMQLTNMLNIGEISIDLFNQAMQMLTESGKTAAEVMAWLADELAGHSVSTAADIASQSFHGFTNAIFANTNAASQSIDELKKYEDELEKTKDAVEQVGSATNLTNMLNSGQISIDLLNQAMMNLTNMLNSGQISIDLFNQAMHMLTESGKTAAEVMAWLADEIAGHSVTTAADLGSISMSNFASILKDAADSGLTAAEMMAILADELAGHSVTTAADLAAQSMNSFTSAMYTSQFATRDGIDELVKYKEKMEDIEESASSLGKALAQPPFGMGGGGYGPGQYGSGTQGYAQGGILGGRSGVDTNYGIFPTGSYIVNAKATARHLGDLLSLTGGHKPIRYTSGEFYVDPNTTKNNIGLLNKINADGFAKGGFLSQWGQSSETYSKGGSFMPQWGQSSETYSKGQTVRIVLEDPQTGDMSEVYAISRSEAQKAISMLERKLSNKIRNGGKTNRVGR